MGMINWIAHKLKANVTYIFEVKNTVLPMPKQGECIIFQFPEGTPIQVVDQFDQRLVEFQNSERKFITTNLKLEYKPFKKKETNMEVESNDRNISGEDIGHSQTEKQGSHPGRVPGSVSERNSTSKQS